ncbi:PREDICTED: lysosomal acid lipase/cholesteryl ester hydrolase-like, partial [Wasmannia auropunctata]|uniref:lysosomal acid lipase/cholesteryl ester hydrolase-like n=1 Tax=Wasmannia auropunctata TaxID=64793 RepID=UPI0005EDEDF3
EFFDVNAIYDIFPLSSTSITIGRTLCTDEAITQAVCVTALFMLGGSDPTQLNTTILPKFFSYFPAGLSVQTLSHYSQNIMTEKFQAYDYGYLGNYKQYGQMTPIMYDFKKVTVPLALFYGAHDFLAPKLNVLETYKHLPNVILLEEITHKLFTHFDFVIAIDVKTLLYDRVIELLQRFRNRT